MVEMAPQPRELNPPTQSHDDKNTMDVHDNLGRPLRSLRLSVTDRCNLRCAYCMPEADYVWLPRENILRFEEISRLVDIFQSLGTNKIRVTGGEPLLRRDLYQLIHYLSEKPGFKELSLTTNGILLAEQAERLRRAGLHRVTISLDTLKPERFKSLSGQDMLGNVLEGIRAATHTGFSRLKINMVVIRDVNDDEFVSMIAFGNKIGAEVRFIEYMDVGGATKWSYNDVVPGHEILRALRKRYGSIDILPVAESSPSKRFRLPDGTSFGIITSTSTPFCRTCDRSRLTADGQWYLCLYSQVGFNLRDLLRSGRSDGEIKMILQNIWERREDKGAEDRLRLMDRGPLYPIGKLHNDPHLEMHTRGG